MATDVVMPALGPNQETGRLIAWLKQEGDAVVKGEPLMEVETDKTSVEIEAQASGTLANVTARIGDEVPVGRPIAVILAPGELAPAGEAGPGEVPPAGDDGPGASPKARRLAAELGVDLDRVAGSGPGGSIKAADLAAAEPQVVEPQVAAAGAAPTVQRARSGVWETMARRTTESWQQAPHFYLEREVDASRLVSWRSAAARTDAAVTITDLLIRLAAAALTRHDRVNSGAAGVNVGLAVAVDDGLVVPVISSADRLSLAQISAARRQVVERARAGRLRPEDVQGATFTISNLGMFAVDAFSAIVNSPQAAILATGRIADRVIAVGGVPTVRPTLRMTLSFDHRAVDGARGAAFLTDLGDLVEEPAALL